jgi:hypothetical protein
LATSYLDQKQTKGDEMTETEWAIRNLELDGWFKKDSDYGGMIGEAVKKLLEVHGKEGHSGASHFVTLVLFNKVAQGDALTEEYWQERFNDYNQMARQNGFPEWSEEAFEQQIMKKPKPKSELTDTDRGL